MWKSSASLSTPGIGCIGCNVMHSNVSQRDTVVVIFYNSVLLVEQLVSTLGDNVIYVNFVQFDIDSMSLGVEGT